MHSSSGSKDNNNRSTSKILLKENDSENESLCDPSSFHLKESLYFGKKKKKTKRKNLKIDEILPNLTNTFSDKLINYNTISQAENSSQEATNEVTFRESTMTKNKRSRNNAQSISKIKNYNNTDL